MHNINFNKSIKEKEKKILTYYKQNNSHVNIPVAHIKIRRKKLTKKTNVPADTNLDTHKNLTKVAQPIEPENINKKKHVIMD